MLAEETWTPSRFLSKTGLIAALGITTTERYQIYSNALRLINFPMRCDFLVPPQAMHLAASNGKISVLDYLLNQVGIFDTSMSFEKKILHIKF